MFARERDEVSEKQVWNGLRKCIENTLFMHYILSFGTIGVYRFSYFTFCFVWSMFSVSLVFLCFTFFLFLFCLLCSLPMPNWNLLNVIKCYLYAVHPQSFSDVTWNTILVHFHLYQQHKRKSATEEKKCDF